MTNIDRNYGVEVTGDFSISFYGIILKILLDWGARMDIGNPTANEIIAEYPYQDFYGLEPDISSLEASNTVKDTIKGIQEEYRTYRAKQRSAFAKTQLPSNIYSNIAKYLDTDATKELGDFMYSVDDDTAPGEEYYTRYQPDIKYKKFRKKKYKKRKKKTKKKRKWKKK